jgi:LPS-assembly protein
MMKSLRVLAILMLMFCTASLPALALQRPGLQLPPDTPIHVTAEQIDYDRETDILIGRGNVEIIQGERLLKAEFLTINLATKDTEAQGNVELYESGDVLLCDAFSINLDTQLGTVSNARIFIKQHNIHIDGEEVTRLGADSYAVQRGMITTCDGTNPAWKLRAEKIDVTIEGYARVKHTTFAIKNIPVLYLPFAILPVKTTRQTGFLFPQFSQSSRKGYQLSNSFFWALSENTDATIWLDTATKRGIGTGVEYRFVASENTWGKIYGYGIDESSKYFREEYRQQRDRDRSRRYAHFEGEHYFAADAYIKAKGSYLSDREMYGDYRREIRRSKGADRLFDPGSLEKNESVLFYNKNWDYSNLTLTANVYKNLMVRGPDTVQRLPQIVYSTMQRPLYSSPLHYRFDGAYDYFWREQGDKGHRIDMFPKVTMPMLFDGWLKFTPELGLRGMMYFDTDDARGRNTEGFFPTFRSELSTSLIRVYAPDSAWLSKVKHSIEPGLMYEYIPSSSQNDVPEFDMPEDFYHRHALSYYVKHRFTGLLRTAADTLEEHEIGYFMLGQSYNLRSPRDGVYLDGDPDKEFSDIFAEMRVGFHPLLYLKVKAGYSPYENMVRYHNFLLSWNSRRGDVLQFQYRYFKQRFEVLDLYGSLQLTPYLGLFFDTRYDNYNNKDFDTEIGLHYRSQCWGSKLWIESSSGYGGRSSDVSIKYAFYLRGLGSDMQ